MSKAEEAALKAYPKETRDITRFVIDIGHPQYMRDLYIEGYCQAEKDIKEELSKVFREFMMDCVNDSTDTHILHFIEVFNNKIKTIGNE